MRQIKARLIQVSRSLPQLTPGRRIRQQTLSGLNQSFHIVCSYKRDGVAFSPNTFSQGAFGSNYRQTVRERGHDARAPAAHTINVRLQHHITGADML